MKEAYCFVNIRGVRSPLRVNRNYGYTEMNGLLQGSKGYNYKLTMTGTYRRRRSQHL